MNTVSWILLALGFMSAIAGIAGLFNPRWFRSRMTGHVPHRSSIALITLAGTLFLGLHGVLFHDEGRLWHEWSYHRDVEDRTPKIVGTPQKFSTPTVMASVLGDFPPESGAFRMIRADPLHIQLVITDTNFLVDARQLQTRMLQAFQWGVWRTFMHTDHDEVTVTVIASMAIDGHTTLSGRVRRDTAEHVLQRHLGVQEFAALIMPDQKWTEVAKRCHYEGLGEPGLHACSRILAGRRLF